MNTPLSFESQADISIIYDGDCPFCSNYVKILQLKKTFGQVELINARNRDDIVQLMLQLGMDVDQGMAVCYKNSWYHGAMAMHLLAKANTSRGGVSKLVNAMYASKTIAVVTYPLLRFFRNLTLKILRLKKINQQ